VQFIKLKVGWSAGNREVPVQVRYRGEFKVLGAVGAGVLVWVASSVVDISLLPLDRGIIIRELVGNLVGGLMAVVVALVLQLRHEEVHNRVAIERAATVSELNHHVRNAVFPLCIAVQKLGNADASKIADEAVERINLALRDATADALVGNGSFAAPAQ
jgi:hypothetical protein